MTYTGQDKKYTDTPIQYDPLGRDKNGNNTGSTGGPEGREQVFSTINQYLPQWLQSGDQSYQKAVSAATDPAWKDIQTTAANTGAGNFLTGTSGYQNIWSNLRNAVGPGALTQRTANGEFLNQNPTGTSAQDWRGNNVTQSTMRGDYLYNAPKATANVDPMLAGVRQRGQAEAADANAATRSAYGRAGMGFSTGNQQAQNSATAAATARSNESDSATRFAAQQAADNQKFQGYLAERGYQNQAASSEDAAQRARLAMQAQNYLSERGYQNQAGLTSDAAKNAAAMAEASGRADNYGKERLYQNNAGQQLSNAYLNPINFLNSAGSGNLNQISQIAQLIQGLSGNGQIATPNSQIVRQPGVYDYALQTLGAIGSIV